MHPSSMHEMRGFLAKLPTKSLKIADIGSRSVHGGTYKSLMAPEWSYTGLDMVPGSNVDVVLPGSYDWPNVRTDSFDVVISGQTVEHVERPWLWMKQLARIVRTGGVVCVIGPYQWAYHAFPKDCWRIYPDGMRAIMEDAGLAILKVYMNKSSDTVGVGAKEASDIWSPE